MTMVAEGVEDGETADQLALSSCDKIQGFFYSKALPPCELERWLDARQPGPILRTSPRGRQGGGPMSRAADLTAAVCSTRSGDGRRAGESRRDDIGGPDELHAVAELSASLTARDSEPRLHSPRDLSRSGGRPELRWVVTRSGVQGAAKGWRSSGHGRHQHLGQAVDDRPSRPLTMSGCRPRRWLGRSASVRFRASHRTRMRRAVGWSAAKTWTSGWQLGGSARLRLPENLLPWG